MNSDNGFVEIGAHLMVECLVERDGLDGNSRIIDGTSSLSLLMADG